jgi:TRAP-type mannitol/chloroaromatic compound transport system permease small subunit
VIPIAAFFMLVQGVVEVIRIIYALKIGEWPERLSDVEETETRLAKESQM